MKSLGVTGSIGMGKSTVGAMLATMGFAVHDADATVRVLLRRRDVILSIAKRFPQVVDRGIVDRRRLAARVFTDPAARRQLEALLHPLVVRDQESFLRRHRRQRRRFVVLDIPLLFETSADVRVDVTVVVTAAGFIQRSRVLGRSSMTPQRFQAILEAQMPDKEKRHWADVMINTGAGRRLTWCQVYTMTRLLLKHGKHRRRKYARNRSRY